MSSMFGSFATQPQQQQQQPAKSFFGPQPGGGLFGSTVGSGTLGRGGVVSQQDAQAQFTALASKIEAIAAAWGVGGGRPTCRFQHYFYNLVDPAQVRLYGRPPNAWDDEAWAKAVRENPDPTCLVPVLAVGFDDLLQRVNAQSQQAIAQEEKLKELRSRIEALALRHSTSNIACLRRASAAQTQLKHRLLKLVQHLHLLVPSLRSSAIRPEEEALRVALEEIEEEVKKKGVYGGRMRAKLNELWALVSALQAARDRERSENKGSIAWSVVDEDGMGQLVQILSEQQTGLAHLTKVLKKDMKDMDIILGATVAPGDKAGLFHDTSPLRGSLRL